MFNTVFEYPLLVAILPLFRAVKRRDESSAIPIIFGLALFAVWRIFHVTGADTKTEALALAHTTLIFICYKFKDYPRSVRYLVCDSDRCVRMDSASIHRGRRPHLHQP